MPVIYKINHYQSTSKTSFCEGVMFTQRNWVAAVTVLRRAPRHLTVSVIIVILFVYSFFINTRPKIQSNSLFVRLARFENSSTTEALIENGDNESPIKQLVDPCDFLRVLDKHVNQENPCLVDIIRKKMLIPPPPPDDRSPQHSRSPLPPNKEKFQWVKELLVERQGIRQGFFVELGASNREVHSPTILIESKLDWSGLLIEPTQEFQKLIRRKRNVWAINVAVSKHPYPENGTLSYNRGDMGVGVSGLKYGGKNWREEANITVQSLPLYTMLKAVNKTDVDYLSLDVEGFELAVLKTLPWDKVSFKMITSAYKNIKGGGLPDLTAFLDGKGYKFITTFSDSNTQDGLFVKENLYEDAKAINSTIFA